MLKYYNPLKKFEFLYLFTLHFFENSKNADLKIKKILIALSILINGD
jgi:hypothetical protein